jgi:hypothetical protein
MSKDQKINEEGDEGGKWFDSDGSIRDEQKKVDAGTFKVVNKTENEDGTFSYEFEYDANFALYYQMKTGRKRVTQKGISKFIIKLLEARDNGSLEDTQSLSKKEEDKRRFYKVYK